MAGGTFPEEISGLIKPELVAAMAVYLVSDRCSATGRILSAGGGYYSHVQFLEGKGLRFGKGATVRVESIAEHFQDIISMREALPYENATENVVHILEPLLKPGDGPGSET
jgi:hypothetical protein